MKFLVASDLHGSAYYCEKLLNCFELENADKLILLGDLLYHGPRNELPEKYNPKAVADMLNNYHNKIIAVKGNCDSDVDQFVLHFPIKAEYLIMYLNNKLFYLTHGDKYSANDLTSNTQNTVYLYGHTHVFECDYVDNVLCLNPGSVSIPKQNDIRGYFIIDEKDIIYKTLNGEVLKQIAY